MFGSRPGRKGLDLKKHRPIEFRISDFWFLLFNPHSAIPMARLLNGIEGAS
jgi:hypothetical protein